METYWIALTDTLIIRHDLLLAPIPRVSSSWQMSDVKSTRRVYSADELHSLRNAYSVLKLQEAIEEKDGEDAELVKEHILRGSRSFTARSFRSRQVHDENGALLDRTNDKNAGFGSSVYQDTALVTSHGVLGEIASNNQLLRACSTKPRPSPTPSLKRQKAEAIVRAHGSPTHVRVTAGGRIVPREQSPLCFPRFGYSAIKINGGLIKFAPNHPVGKGAQWTQSAHDGLQNGFVAQDTEGRLCQVVDGAILPLTEADGALRLYMPAPNLNITHRDGAIRPPQAAFPPAYHSTDRETDHHSETRPAVPLPVVPSASAQIHALELEYAKLEHELKDLDKTEVIHGKTMSKPAKEALVGKRRELVLGMDRVRKALKAVKEQPQPAAPVQSPRLSTPSARSPLTSESFFVGPPFERAVSGDHRSAGHTAEQAFANTLYGMHAFMPVTSPYAIPAYAVHDETFAASYMLPPPGMLVNPAPFDGSHGWALPFQSFPSQTVVENETEKNGTSASSQPQHMPQHDGTASKSDLRSPSARQSHAVEVKDPETKQVITAKSLLDPKSPVYDPANRSGRGRVEARAPLSTEFRSPTPLLFKGSSEPPAQSTSSDKHLEHGQRTVLITESSPASSPSPQSSANDPRASSSVEDDHHTPDECQQDKENEPPHKAKDTVDGSVTATASATEPGTNHASLSDMLPPPKAPPGTPTHHRSAVPDTQYRTQDIISPSIHIDQDVHNASPYMRQSRRTRVAGGSPFANDGNSSEKSLAKDTDKMTAQPASDQAMTIDFSHMSSDWIQGYQAGLKRRAVGADCTSTFLDGYCSGLLKVQSLSSRTGVSPSVIAHRSGQVMQQSGNEASLLHSSYKREQHSPFKTVLEATDCLQEAVRAPSNELAILSPDQRGPHVDEMSRNLGAWQKHHHEMMSANGDGLCGFTVLNGNERVSNDRLHGSAYNLEDLQPRFRAQSEDDDSSLESTTQLSRRGASHAHPPAQLSSERNVSTSRAPSPRKHSKPHLVNSKYDAPTDLQTLARRTLSDNLNHRIANPLGWRSGTSVGQVANLTSSFFSNAQYDGQPSDKMSLYSDSTPMLASATDFASPSAFPHVNSRFREGCLQGPASPVSPRSHSPSVSPKTSSYQQSAKIHSAKTSPQKEIQTNFHSPTKARLGHLVEKVGIRVSPEKSAAQEDVGGSPGKHRWRDIWKGARRDPARTGPA